MENLKVLNNLVRAFIASALGLTLITGATGAMALGYRPSETSGAIAMTPAVNVCQARDPRHAVPLRDPPVGAWSETSHMQVYVQGCGLEWVTVNNQKDLEK